jgi:hypothetical protein
MVGAFFLLLFFFFFFFFVHPFCLSFIGLFLTTRVVESGCVLLVSVILLGHQE